MRMRKKKNSSARIERCAQYLVRDPSSIYNDAYAPFSDELRGGRVYLELGCGKGDFICGMAARDPDGVYYAVERIDSIMMFALEKRRAQLESDASLPDNVRFIIGDASRVAEWFAPGTLCAIFLNFSDPWPKKGYYKRRMTYRGFLSEYSKILVPGGELRVKTDNVVLFDFTLEELASSDFDIIRQTRDLHNSEYAVGNIETEYERRFSEAGVPNNAVWAANRRGADSAGEGCAQSSDTQS